MTTIELNVTGMTCGHCQKSVKQALQDVPGVTDAQVDLQRGRAVVQGTPDAGQLIAAVAEEGYGAEVVATR